MKYENNKELLPEYYDALINFKDWIPSVIQFELPTEISLAVGGLSLIHISEPTRQ